MMFGFVQEKDLQPLRDKITALELELKAQQNRNRELGVDALLVLNRVMALERYCYNIGGDVALLRRESQLIVNTTNSNVGDLGSGSGL